MTVAVYLRMFVVPGLWVPDEQIIGGRTVTRRHPDKLYKVHNNTKLDTPKAACIADEKLSKV